MQDGWSTVTNDPITDYSTHDSRKSKPLCITDLYFIEATSR